MKSLHYISGSTLPSQAANSVHVMKMCRAFVHCGMQTTLFARGDATKTGEIFQYYGLEPEFDLALSPKHRIHLSRWALRLFAYRRLTAQRHLPDLVYGRDPAALYWLGHRLQRPFVYEAHHLPTSAFQRRIVTALIRSPRLQGIVVISDALREDMLQLYPALKDTRIITAHDGADVPVVTPQPVDLTEPGKEFSLEVGYVGSLYQGRGIDLILALAARFPQIRFHFLGGTPQEIAAWKERGVPDNVRFHGHRPHHEVQAWLAAFDVLLAPYPLKVRIGTGYDTGRWMSPLKIFEYMAAGKAIIGSDLPVLREVLSHGETAQLAMPESVEDWEAAIKVLLGNSDFREELGKRALSEVRENFTWMARAQKIMDQHLE